MTLQLAGYELDSRDRVRVGMTYVQKGLRWIPSYRVDVDGQGKARVKLQATLVNDLVDLNDVTVRLVVGGTPFCHGRHARSHLTATDLCSGDVAAKAGQYRECSICK